MDLLSLLYKKCINYEDLAKMKQVEIKVGEFQKKNGLETEDQQAFNRIYWHTALNNVKYIFYSLGLVWYFVGDVNFKLYRFPIAHYISHATQKCRPFPNIRREPIRFSLGILVLAAYLSIFPVRDFYRINMTEKMNLPTLYGQIYRRTLHDIDATHPMLQKTKIKDYEHAEW